MQVLPWPGRAGVVAPSSVIPLHFFVPAAICSVAEPCVTTVGNLCKAMQQGPHLQDLEPWALGTPTAPQPQPPARWEAEALPSGARR